MRKPTTLFTIAFAIFALTLAVTATATAGRLSTSNKNFRVAWTPLTLSSGSGEGGITVRCNLTLEGSFHYDTIVKQARALIGYVTRAASGHPCTGGEAWALNGVERPTNTLPWHISYEGFEGTLPSISGVRFLLTPSMATEGGAGLCLNEGNIQGVIKLTRGVGTNVLPDSTIGISKRSGGILCPSIGFFSQEVGATSTIRVLGTTQSITITLI